MLDELCAAGEFAWLGRGSLGRDDGRIAVYRRERFGDLAPRPGADVPGSEVHRAILESLRSRGASFFVDLISAARAPLREVLDALWDLVWAGVVTNDTFAPVRALAWPKRGAAASPRGRGSFIPPEGAGRWSLAFPGDEAANATARAHGLAGALLERYGVVTREVATAEGLAGGFSTVYPVLKAMEEGGRVRRGYFVEGLGGAQFALPGAVDRLRGERDVPSDALVHVIAATDPANPYGAVVAWLQRDGDERRSLQRVAGAYVVLVDGEPILYLDRGGRSLTTFLADGEQQRRLAVEALKSHGRDARAGNHG